MFNNVMNEIIAYIKFALKFISKNFPILPYYNTKTIIMQYFFAVPPPTKDDKTRIILCIIAH